MMCSRSIRLVSILPKLKVLDLRQQWQLWPLWVPPASLRMAVTLQHTLNLYPESTQVVLDFNSWLYHRSYNYLGIVDPECKGCIGYGVKVKRSTTSMG